MGIDVAVSDDPWYDSVMKSMGYITNVIGPVNLILDVGFSLDKNGQLEWHEVAAGWAGLVMLWIDTVSVWKIMTWGGWVLEKIWKTGKYIVRPITDIWSFMLNVWKTGVNVVDVAKSKSSMSFKEAILKGFEKQKKMWMKWKALLIGTLVAAWYIGFETLTDDYSKEFEFLIEAGIIDNKWNPLLSYNEQIENLEDEQKEVYAENIIYKKFNYRYHMKARL